MTALLDPTMLIELQAALRAGAGAGEAFAATCRTGPIGAVAHQVRLGASLQDVAATTDTGDAGADGLVRSLALAERTGAGAVEAVEQALDGIEAERGLQRMVAIRTAQARGTAVVLAVVPVAAWTLLVAADRGALAFYATPIGLFSAALAVGMATLSWWWMRRMTAAVPRAAMAADPLHASGPPRPWRRAVAPAVLATLVAAPLLGPAGILVGGLVAITLARRPRGLPQPAGGGAAEAVDLVAVALTAGLATTTALNEVARLAPPSAADELTRAARRTAAGWPVAEAFAGGPLEPLGAVLSACQTWGAPAAPALRRLSSDLRSQRTTAAEVAAERLQLTLVFPTTLLTLPAFVLGVVPPLLWSTLQR